MNKYERLMQDLESNGFGTMKCFGNSMMPVLKNPSTCDYRRQEVYEVGDIVFCKVRGRYIDAHKITKRTMDGQYMIANNKGRENGLTRTIYGKVFRATDNHKNEIFFE